MDDGLMRLTDAVVTHIQRAGKDKAARMGLVDDALAILTPDYHYTDEAVEEDRRQERRTDMGDIGQAVAWLREGRRVRRSGWNGEGMWLTLLPERESQGTGIGGYVWQEHVVMKTAGGTVVPWLCSQTDLLANDWERVQG